MTTQPAQSILIIEDEKLYCQLAVTILQGNHRHIANTAREGLEMFERLKPDITFLDIGLPDANGIDILAVMKRLQPEAFIVILTASHLAEDVQRAKHFGAAGYIVKPFTTGKVRAYLDLYNDYVRKLQSLNIDALEALYRECFDKAESIQLQFDAKPAAPESHISRRNQMLHHWAILYVDDDVDQAERIQRRIEQAGCNIHLAYSAQEALQAVARSEYHMLFISQELQEMNGIALAHELRRAEYQMPLVMVTDDPSLIDDPSHRILHLSGYLLRPLKYNTIISSIHAVIDQSIEQESERYIS